MRFSNLLLVSVLILCAAELQGQSMAEPSGVSIAVTSAGTFTVQGGGAAWTYSGSVSGHVTNIAGPVGGSDNNEVSTNGRFDEFTVKYSDPEGNPWQMQVRAYRNLPSATISFGPLASVPNARPYAVLNQFPITPHHFSNSGWNRAFGLVGWMTTDSAWVFFDDQFRASILSAASRPISERQVWVNDHSENGAIALEIDSTNAVLPAGDVYSHLITFDQGIGQTFSVWGSTLRNMAGRPITGNQADVSLVKPMLSTDAGASYYYFFEPALGYEGTLRAAIASAQAVGIPFGLVHFDSWWYRKGGNCDAVEDPNYAPWNNVNDGVWKFVTDPAILQPINGADPEDGFIQNLGPGMAHGRWIDACSPYRLPTLDDVGDTLVTEPVSGNVIVDRGIWARIARALQQSGMVLFEQDFLATTARAANTFDDERFLSAMSAAMAENGIDLQYCMPLASDILQAFQDEHVHTIRVSGDRFRWKHWDQEMYGSMMVNAGGVWPTVDNFRSVEQRNLLLAVMSAGPVALSDPIGAFVPIDAAIRSDGVILKPDVSMVPTDGSFVAEASAIEQFYGVNGATASNAGNKATLIRPVIVGHTYSDFGSNKVEYVFAYSRDVNAPAAVSVTPQDFGFWGDVYVYDYFGKAGWRQPAAQAIARSVDSQGSYFVIASIGESGMGLVGDLSKFATASKQRVLSMSDTGQITAALEFAPGETVPISIYSPSRPVVSADGATVSSPAFDSTTGLYTVAITSGQNGAATIRIAQGR
jgi:hypothetical protein